MLACAPAVAAQRGAAARGEADYATYCAPCHGLQGNGDGPLARLLVPKPARHTDTDFMNALSDDYLFRLLDEGGPALGKSELMGAWGRSLSQQRIGDLVAYLRSLTNRNTKEAATQ
jgi:mono/diheme cytochrome c family protein